jgi:hypothetical protein
VTGRTTKSLKARSIASNIAKLPSFLAASFARNDDTTKISEGIYRASEAGADRCGLQSEAYGSAAPRGQRYLLQIRGWTRSTRAHHAHAPDRVFLHRLPGSNRVAGNRQENSKKSPSIGRKGREASAADEKERIRLYYAKMGDNYIVPPDPKKTDRQED